MKIVQLYDNDGHAVIRIEVPKLTKVLFWNSRCFTLSPHNNYVEVDCYFAPKVNPSDL